MAITDSLTTIKNYFKEWHTTYYNELHINLANKITNDPVEGEKLPTSKLVFDYIKNYITTTITNTGTEASKLPTSASIYNFFMNKWKAASKTQDGYLTKGNFNTFYQGGATSYVDKTYTNGSSNWRRQGRICIVNLRGLKIGKGKELDQEYILCAVPDAAHKPAGSTYLGSFSYDEVKWLAIRNFDNYNPTSTSYVKWWDGSQWKKFTKTDAQSHYKNGAVIYKPRDRDNDRYVYATITYYCANEL